MAFQLKNLCGAYLENKTKKRSETFFCVPERDNSECIVCILFITIRRFIYRIRTFLNSVCYAWTWWPKSRARLILKHMNAWKHWNKNTNHNTLNACETKNCGRKQSLLNVWIASVQMLKSLKSFLCYTLNDNINCFV